MKRQHFILLLLTVALSLFAVKALAGTARPPTTSEVLSQIADNLYNFSAASENGRDLEKLKTANSSEEWQIVERSPDLLRVRAIPRETGEFTLRRYLVTGHADEAVFVASGGYGQNWQTRFFRYSKARTVVDSKLSPRFKPVELLLPGDSIANPADILPLTLLADTGELNVTPVTWMQKAWEQKSGHRQLHFVWDGVRFARAADTIHSSTSDDEER